MENSESDLTSIVQAKFRSGESVISVLRAKNASGNVLLALINCLDSNVIFQLSLLKLPPRGISDLQIGTFYAIIKNYLTVEKGILNSFTISSQDVHVTFTYDEEDKQKFIDFHHLVLQASETNLTRPNYEWLHFYRRDDLSDINPSIAGGQTKLIERDAKSREELYRRSNEYTFNKKYRIYVATWNVNEATVPVALNEWLSVGAEPPDIYAIAMQELDMTATTITRGETRPDTNWSTQIMTGLHTGAHYEELTTVRLVGMQLTIAINTKTVQRSDIAFNQQYVGTGALNFMGNKGGVGVSMLINKTPVCFVNSHLAAHQTEVEQRKEDFDQINSRMIFQHGIKRMMIIEHSLVFWFGDLNYRIDAASDRIKDLIEMKRFDTLVEYDQLYKQRKMRAVFQEYTEGPLRFQPTYKYNPNTDIFDSSEKARAPAWCDRVLWHTKSQPVELHDYNSIMKMKMSDHKPVYATFSVHIPTVDHDKMKRINEEILKSMDKYENDNQPQIAVSETDIDFEQLKFNEKYSRELLIANNHHLPVEFNFRVKNRRDDDNGSFVNGVKEKICENWLTVYPTRGTLLTGQTMSIMLEVCIDSKSASILNRLQQEPNVRISLDILVLHVENGRDIFISIMGEYKPSCFGFPLETLIMLPEPIATINLRDIWDLQSVQLRTERNYRIPREVYFLVNDLKKNAMMTQHLFDKDRKYGRNPIMNEIRDWLDSWSTDPYPGTPHTTAEALLMLLESTPEKLLESKENEILFNCNNLDLCYQHFGELNEVKKMTFLYLCLFLRCLKRENASFNRQNQNEDLVATLFGPVFFKEYEKYRRAIRIFVNNILDNTTSFENFAVKQLKINLN